ncbi:MAG: rRNA maturation RNase YbeY, partial [Acidobacteriota bacterium]
SPDDIPLLFRTSRRVDRAELRGFLGELTRRVLHGRTISCLIADDAAIRRLNRQYRGKNQATDVLSFSPASPNGIAGDIAISIDRARMQAAQYGHSLTDEVRILMLHGALHLAGMDHEADSGEMARAESRWRKRLGLPDGLLERSRGERSADKKAKP